MIFARCMWTLMSSVLSWYRPKAEEPPIVVYVEANIGAGKSELLTKLENYGFKVVQEPVELWRDFNGVNFLDLFSKNMAKWPFTSQVMAISTMWRVQRAASVNKHRVIITERSVCSGVKMFAKVQEKAKLINIQQYWLLEDMAENMAQSLQRQELFIYLKVSPEIAHQRMRKRARKEESSLPLEYFKDLHTNLDNWMQNEKKLYLEVDATKNPDAVFQQVLSAIQNL